MHNHIASGEKVAAAELAAGRGSTADLGNDLGNASSVASSMPSCPIVGSQPSSDHPSPDTSHLIHSQSLLPTQHIMYSPCNSAATSCKETDAENAGKGHAESTLPALSLCKKQRQTLHAEASQPSCSSRRLQPSCAEVVAPPLFFSYITVV